MSVETWLTQWVKYEYGGTAVNFNGPLVGTAWRVFRCGWKR
jgi:hypothetical protein